MWRLAQKKPGRLSRIALDEMSRYLADKAETEEEAKSWRGQRVTAYLNQVIMTVHGPQKVGLRMTRELQTLSTALDHLMAGRLAHASDTLIQRLKACETSLWEGGWSTAKHLEIIPPTTATLVQPEERELATKQELRALKMREALKKADRSK